MGLLVNDVITLRNGIQLSNVYLTISKSTLSMIPGRSATLAININPGDTPPDYTVVSQYTFFKDQNSYVSKLAALQEGDWVNIPITKDQTSTPIHVIVYDYLKENIFMNTTDC